ncbi:AMP-binding protein [Mycobacterium sp. PSTR-4-N]|uniref:AMP-binding protein n=1 Tax=Mycobacterium sp. PSTR-4-N TaxID=2917745 RepID=UPI001F1508B3|nr:AMP-binding protein [Mycobacterium sp. PSTR-4-N]MCG7595708.1 AMP-binding protein [Mycobacterium sp. PSTR-4-N]
MERVDSRSLTELLAACATLMSDVGEASLRAIAHDALGAYADLDDDAKLHFFSHITTAYDVDADRVRAAFQQWDDVRESGSHAGEELIGLFTAVEPARQQLLRRMNHAPGATLALVEMRADLRRLMRTHPGLRPLDHDFHHLLTSWFNRGFLHMSEVTWNSPPRLREHLLRYESVHPMTGDAELRRRLQPDDRRVYAFFHPATGDVPLIFVEVALVQGIPDRITPLLEADSPLDPSSADTAVLYSINNALDGLAGVSFGSFLIKQVIEQVSAELPHLRQFATISPIPGFRTWLDARIGSNPELRSLADELDMLDPADLTPARVARCRDRLLSALLTYLTVERRDDGRPVDAVARFHLGNGAAAWRLNWPANPSAAAWQQSYGAMVNYLYEPSQLERRHEEFVRRRSVAVTGPLHALADARSRTHERGTPPMAHPPTIYRMFTDHVARQPDKALFEVPDGRTVSYRDTADTVHRIAARLVADGVTPGDRVAMQVAKSPEAVALYLATLQIGGVFLPLNTAYTAAEMRYFLGDAQPRVLVCAPERQADYADLAAELGDLADGLVVETLGESGDGTLLRDDQRHEEIFDADATDLAAILYTSGTTGRSKGAMLTHGNLASNCQALVQAWRYTADDRLIHALPIFHIHGLFVAVNMTLAAGASMYYLSKFDTDAIVDLLPRATVLMGVPTFYTRLLKSPRLTAEQCSQMRLFVSGSAPLLASDHEAFAARTGHAILERYGMTETGMNTTNPYDGGPRKPGTVGKPLPGTEMRVVDRDTAEVLPDGDVGIVEVRGPNVFAGYWQMPDKTAAEFRSDGFFITGDLGRIDEDGYLCIVGRDKDLVISGGYNIYPKEIEELLDGHPKVLESAVIGVPHPEFGETVVAVVVPAPDQQPQERELLDHVAADLARFKQPRAVRVVDALPRNVMGKVQKAELRTRYADLFADVDA